MLKKINKCKLFSMQKNIAECETGNQAMSAQFQEIAVSYLLNFLC